MSRLRKRIIPALLLSASGLLAPAASAADYSPYTEQAYPTKLLFGETHVHSALSADAGGGGTRLMPRDVYRFAAGEKVNSNTGQAARLA